MARSRVLCIGDHLQNTAEELRGAGFDVLLAPNSHAALALIHLYPPEAILGDPQEIRAIQEKYAQIPALPMSRDGVDKIPPNSTAQRVNDFVRKTTVR